MMKTSTYEMNIWNFILLGLVLCILSCQNYSSEKYIQEENDAIQQLIPDLIDLEGMFDSNEIEDNTVKLMLVSELHAEIKLVPELEEQVVEEFDGLPTIIEMVESELHKEEKKCFKPFLNGSIQSRILTKDFTNKRLAIIKVVENDTSNFMQQCQNDTTIFGYLWISRIAFDRSFETGYLRYSFYCGQGCAWDNNIEIKKKSGKWYISRYFSGGIA